MKIKDLKYGIDGECDLRRFCLSQDVCLLSHFLVYRRSSCSYYLYVKRFGFSYPFAHHRISANADVLDVINSTLALV